MTNAPNPGNEPDPQSTPQSASPSPRRSWQKRLLLFLSIILLLGIAGGITGAWIFIQRMLAPMVERNLTRLLNRPVEMGQVERFSLNSLRFNGATLPATPTDSDRATVEAVEVAYNPLQLVLNRKLELHVTLISPNVYIEQEATGRWVGTEIQTQEPGAIDVELQSVQVRNADVVLVPRSQTGQLQPAVSVAILRGNSQFLNDNQLIRFDLQGRLVSGGNFALRGEHLPPTRQTNLLLNGQNLSAPELNRLVPLPLDLHGGQVGGDLEVQLQPEQPVQLLGTATLNNVTARLPQLPQPFANSNGRLRFKGTKIQLEEVNTQFGQIPAQANGLLDTQAEINLTAQTQPVQPNQILQTFNIKNTPVPLAGEVQAALQVTGPIAQPVVSGTLTNTKLTQIDRVVFRTVSTDFQLTTPQAPQESPLLRVNNLRAIPTVGGTITGQGIVELGQGGGLRFNLQANTLPTTAIAKNYNLTLPVPVGPVSGRVQIFGPLDNPQKIRATGTASLPVAGGTVTATNLQLLDNRLVTQLQAQGVRLERLAEVPPQFRGPLAGRLNLAVNLEDVALSNIQGRGSGQINLAGGTIIADNLILSQGRWQANVDATRVQLGRLFPEIPQPLQVPADATFALSGSLEDLSLATIRGQGIANLPVAGGTVRLTDVELAAGRWQAQIQAAGVQLGRLVPELPPQFRSPFNGTFRAAGSLEEFSPGTINVSGGGRLTVGGGTVQVADVNLAAGRWQARVATDNVQVAALVPQLPPQVSGPLTGIFNLSGSVDQLALSAIRGTGSGRLNVAGGTVRASEIQLAAGRWQADVQAAGVQLGQLLPQLPPEFSGPFTGAFDLSGRLDQIALDQIQAQGRGSLNVAGGTVTGTNLQLTNGRLQGIISPQGIELARFGEPLQGTLGGTLRITTNLATLTPEAIARSLRAEGQLTFSEGLAVIDRPLATTFRWTGDGIALQQATAAGLSASGFIGVNPEQLDQGILAAIGALNLDVVATELNLGQLSAYLPPAVADLTVAGLADFGGTIRGTINNPRIQGNLQLAGFALDGLAFEPLLTGTVSTVPGQGVELNLTGNNDRIELALGPDYLPTSFTVQRGEAIALGTRDGDLLRVNTQSFPIGLIGELAPLPTAIAIQPLIGDISGDLAINLDTFDIDLERVEIAGPIFGRRLRDEGLVGNNRYLLSGRIIQTPGGPQVEGQVEIIEGQLETLVAALQLIDLAQVSPTVTAPLDVAAVGLPEAPLKTQLRRFSEIQNLLEQQREQDAQASPLPDLEEIEGTFTGTVAFSGSLANGISTNFNIQGQDWTWDAFEINQAVIQGSFQEGVLTLLPVRLQTGDRLAMFSGTIGGETQSGQLRLQNIPIALIREVVDLPPAIGFGGQLNATAILSGSLANPQARGEVTVVEGTVNQETIQAVQGSFSYNNARLNFSVEGLLAADSDPLLIAGSIPYQLPFPEAVAPASNELTLNINVRDQGLALLNILTRQQIAWIEGTGAVNLAIQGLFDQEQGRPTALVAQGIATVSNATIDAQALPEPLTNVDGTIEFNFDQINVTNLTGNFGGGQIVASGTIPITQPVPQTTPLTVDIGELAINLKGLYRGRLQESQLVVTGTALNPTLSGSINLVSGVVPLPEGNGAEAGTGIGGGTDTGFPIEFNNLEITLVRDIEIRRAPILAFLAQGTLTLNGSLDTLRPQGEIQLRRGQVNLFTTQFRLARGYNHTARFIPAQGLDPFLDVRLVASVAEATQQRLPTGPQSAEIVDDLEMGFGRVQTVRVVARVEGPASQLNERLELTSTPTRSEAEIVSLLGGGFVDTLGRGDSTLGLANLAGSALLGNVSNIIGDALGLTDFRLFPTVVPDDEQRRSTLGLAAEAGVDVTNNISVSVLKELTTDQPFQYGLRYRLNEDILLRGSTDFSGDSRAVVEYERRF